MRSARFALIACAFLCTLFPPSRAEAVKRKARARLTVCTFSFNTPHEVEAFRSELPVKDFEVLDLSPPPLIEQTPQSAGAATVRRETDPHWLSKTCRRDLKCDLVVISAEFAGRFFGASGTSMGMHEMEEASCQAACEGLFHAPREVFLLACNTLATKDADRRTPEEYMRVLLEHGFDRGTAERVTALRYGPLGPSFRAELQRIFQGVPRIYGFSSIAPAGDYTAKALQKYFRSKGNYRTYLERAKGSTARNRELLAAFHLTDIFQASGLSAKDPANADRKKICSLYDEGVPVAQRLRIVRDLLARPDFLAFLPSIEVFVDRHPSEKLVGEERRLFDEVRGSKAARDRVLELIRGSQVSALKMELAQLAVNMEWMTPEEFRRLALEGTRKLIAQPLSAEVVDIMCEIAKHEPLGNAIPSKDLPDTYFQTAEGIRFVDCLAPSDAGVTPRLLPALSDKNVWTRLWAGYAISRRLPLDDETLRKLASHLDEAPAVQQERLRWIFKVQEARDEGVSDAVYRAVVAEDAKFARTLTRKAGPPRSLRPGR